MEGYSKYYQQELDNLRELAQEFAEVHPAIAPMLSGQASDPDVERLLEGTAFLSGMLRQKIDDDLPEIIHSLTSFIFPHLLKSIPSITLVRFLPRKGLQETLRIKAGTELGALPVENVSAVFRTCCDCLVQPLTVAQISASGSATRGQQMVIGFTLPGPGLDTWIPERIPMFIGGSYSRAADIYYLLTRKLKKIVVEAGDGQHSRELPPTALRHMAFHRSNSLFPYPGNSFSGYRYLQEYFLLPHKFLCFEVAGLDKWTDRGSGRAFTLRFELDPASVSLPVLDGDSLILSAVPAINLFKHEAEPLTQDHRRDRIRVTPALKDGVRPDIYSIDEVTGYTRGAMEKREYTPTSFFASGQRKHVYSLSHSISPVDNRPQLALQFAYPPAETAAIAEETLSVKLTCSNGDLPQRLKTGDICQPTSTTPELVEFTNIMRPTLPIDPPLSGGLLWKLLSHLSLNLLSMANVNNLVEMLRLYIFKHDRDKGRISSNEKRLQGIEDFSVEEISRLHKGHMMRGQKIRVVARSDYFAGQGDFCLFGTVLENLFSEYCSMNTFIQLELRDSVSGETYAWPIRIGSRTLI